MLWNDKDMNWAGEPNCKRGRCPSFSEAAIQFCLRIKNLYGLALRQTTGMVRSLLALAGPLCPTFDCPRKVKLHRCLLRRHLPKTGSSVAKRWLDFVTAPARARVREKA